MKAIKIEKFGGPEVLEVKRCRNWKTRSHRSFNKKLIYWS